MNVKEVVIFFLVFVLFLCCCRKQPTPVEECPSIYVGTSLSYGFGMGVNSSTGRTDWVEDLGGYMKMSYPSGESWGAVFITVGGDPVPPPRPSIDLSHCRKLSVDLKGVEGSEVVDIGLKDNSDPDDGSESKIRIDCDSLWVTWEFELDKFETADLSKLYVVCEFVFSGSQAQTVYFRNVKYLP